MAGFVNIFTEFVRSINESGDEHVNMTGLIDDWKVSSPNSMPYDADSFARNLCPVILKNFCSNYQKHPIFYRDGLRALERIINKEANESTEAQRVLCVHLVKMQDRDKHGEKLGNLLILVDQTLHVVAPDDYQVKWIELAKKVFEHGQIRDIVNKNLQEFGLTPFEASTKCEVSFFKCWATPLHGFSGLDRIYINATYFNIKFQNNQTRAEKNEMTETGHKLDLIAKMELIGLSIHEFAHVLLRKVTGNFNANTPTLAKDKNLPGNYNEFGVLAEVSTFGQHVDWSESLTNVRTDYLIAFVDAIENGKPLPTGPMGPVHIRKPTEISTPGICYRPEEKGPFLV